jgi:alkylresorcinol/alkylpyrone synthase
MNSLSGLTTAEPSHCVSTAETKELLAESLPARPAEALQRLVDQLGIERRHTVAPLAELARYPGIEARNAAYEHEAVELASRAARGALEASGVTGQEVGTIFVTSSTGYMVPSLCEHLVARLDLSPSVVAIPINGLGCVGAVRAIGLAARLIESAQGAKTVLVVSVELPSLWLQLAEPSIQDIVASAVFGDGAAAVVVSSDSPPQGFEVLASHAELWSDSLEARRGWLTTTGLRHSASPALPHVVRRNVRRTRDAFLCQNALSPEQLAFQAVNPSDKQLLGVAAEAMGLDEPALRAARQVWANHGNMLSAGPLYLLQALGEEPMRSGATGALIAFGPGVSCDMLLLRRH